MPPRGMASAGGAGGHGRRDRWQRQVGVVAALQVRVSETSVS
ncbi:hypothetical protein ERO13_A08G022300v2 [Gossypium hirsutum]|nr:hypothetical protein ERO13_A08G022300v2 [Gossypium hirsutum]